MKIQQGILALSLAWSSIAFAQSNPICGNGVVEAGEYCDDGNTVSGDGCSANCGKEFCGDKIVNNKGTEECDDGNNIDDDGCKGSCKKSEVVNYSEEIPTLIKITPQEAFQRSLVTTLFLFPPISIIYGPSMGHIAAGETQRVTGMIILRTTLASAMLATGVASSKGTIGSKGGAVLLSLESVGLSIAIAVDLLDASRAVERALANQKKE
jgi:cysteine-rich repeat protein